MTNIEAVLPECIHTFTYVKNHHFIKLTDDDGNSTTLRARDIIQFTCHKCNSVFWMGTNQAAHCPTCLSEDLAKDWVDLQLSFIPESESKFRGPKQKDKP